MGIRAIRKPRSQGTSRGPVRLAMVVLAGVAMAVSALTFATGAQAAAPASGQNVVAASGFPFNIINYNSNKCLQPQTTAPNAIIVQRSCDSTNFLQRWALTDLGDGYSFFVNQGTNQCMDLQANNEDEVGNGTLVQQFICSANYTSEHWNFVSGSRANHYQVFDKDKGLCLDVRNRSSAENAVIQIWDCKFIETAQEFRFVSA
jgi:hypothetical protein